METPYHYRNKVISTFAPAAGGKLTSGIYAARTHKVLPVESCLLQDEVLDKVMLAVRAAANACRYQPFHEDKGTGLLRHCLLRRGVATGQVMVVLVTAQPVLPGAKNFVKALLAEAEKRGRPRHHRRTELQSPPHQRRSGRGRKSPLRQGLHPRHPLRQDLRPQPPQLLSGQPHPDRRALRAGRGRRPPHRQRVVLDAYCGIGTIGLTASDKARQVVGVELNRDAVRDAIGNAKHNGVKNARFFAADATAWIGKPPTRARRPMSSSWTRPGKARRPPFIESVARMAPKADRLRQLQP